MIKFTFFFMCTYISTGYLQELAGYNSFPSIDNSERPGWPLQVYYEEPPVRRKPCPHRRNNVQSEEQWVPSFRSMIKKPLINSFLKPQSLKNENTDADNEPQVSDSSNTPLEESTIPDNLPTIPYPNNENNTATSTGSNLDDIEGPNRRSNFNDKWGNSNEQPFSGEYDCDIDSDAVDYFESEYRNGQYSVTLKPTTVGIEQKVIEMLWDCINKKQKYINGKMNKPEEFFLAGSRRSMGDSVNGEENTASFKPIESDGNKQTTTDMNETTIEILEAATEDSLNHSIPVSIVSVTPAFTLRPGKLFNELQNPAKVTGIADIPVSRRMEGGNSRVCYACSTATNPSCWEPDSRTTIKYCREGQHCVTKSFGVKNSQTLIRDCAESCESSSVAGINPKYNDCSVCHKDLCNSAPTNSYNLIIIFLISAIKYTF